MDFFLKKKESIWINIDKPTKKYTVHHNCSYIENMNETLYKGIGTLKRDGGWIPVNSKKESDSLFKECYSNLTYIEHC